jgi:hypothetical protein
MVRGGDQPLWLLDLSGAARKKNNTKKEEEDMCRRVMSVPKFYFVPSSSSLN